MSLALTFTRLRRARLRLVQGGCTPLDPRLLFLRPVGDKSPPSCTPLIPVRDERWDTHQPHSREVGGRTLPAIYPPLPHHSFGVYYTLKCVVYSSLVLRSRGVIKGGCTPLYHLPPANGLRARKALWATSPSGWIACGNILPCGQKALRAFGGPTSSLTKIKVPGL